MPGKEDEQRTRGINDIFTILKLGTESRHRPQLSGPWPGPLALGPGLPKAVVAYSWSFQALMPHILHLPQGTSLPAPPLPSFAPG